MTKLFTQSKRQGVNTQPASSYIYSFSAALGFCLFLLVIPEILARLIPCMNPALGRSFAYDSCNTAYILDRFMIIALSGFTTGTIILYITQKKAGLKPVIFFACLSAAFIIISYHRFIPHAEAVARNAPILLESLRK